MAEENVQPDAENQENQQTDQNADGKPKKVRFDADQTVFVNNLYTRAWGEGSKWAS